MNKLLKAAKKHLQMEGGDYYNTYGTRGIIRGYVVVHPVKIKGKKRWDITEFANGRLLKRTRQGYSNKKIAINIAIKFGPADFMVIVFNTKGTQ